MTLRNTTGLSVALFFSLATVSIAANHAGDRLPEEVKAQALINYGKLPLNFEENRGQAEAHVKYLSQGNDYAILLAPSEVFLNLRSAAKARRQSTIRMSFPGAKSAPAMAGGERQSAVSSYFIGNDPAKWVKGAPNFARVNYRQIYPGVDLAFYGNQGQIEYDFVVAPGANPGSIRLQFDGVKGMHTDSAGNLVLSAANGEIVQHKPIVYQEGAGGRQIVDGRYIVQAHNRVAFEIARYDNRKPLVIDPTLTFGTYLGSPGEDVNSISAAASAADYPAVAVDLQGNVYVAGYNGGSATSFTGDPGKPLAGGGTDVFIVKMNPTGTALLYSVVFGGGFTDIAGGIAVDAAGNAYVTGRTDSVNFPVTTGAPQSSNNGGGGYNAFVTEVNAAGTGLVYSTYLGGSGNFYGNAIAVDSSGNAYVTGSAAYSGSTAFPLVSPISSSPSSGFLTEIKAGGTSYFEYSTYLPAGIGYGIAVDASGEAYVTGSTGNNSAPSPAQGYVLKVDAGGTAVAWGPVLLGNPGSTLQTVGFGIALDAQNDVYVAGMTNDPSFPQLFSAAQPTYGGGLTDGFALKLNSSGSLVYGTYIGGLGSNILPERASGIGVDAAGNAYVSGTTQCIGFPTVNKISNAWNGGPAVLMKGTFNGSSSSWSPATLAGSFDQVNALAFDSSGNLYAGTSALNATGGGVYKSTDSGNTWAPATSGIGTSTISALAVDPNSPSTVYAAGGGQLYQTTNGGTLWSEVPHVWVGGGAVVAVAKTSPSTVYVGSSAGLIYSTNAGSSWSSPTTLPGAINALVVDPNNPTIAYAGTPSGVYKTVNGGAAWVAINQGFPQPVSVTSLASSTTSTIYAATPNGLFYSTNGGSSWTMVTTLSNLSTPFLVAVDTGNNVYLAFEGAGIAIGTGPNGTSDWSYTYTGLTHQNPILALAVPPTGSGTAYAGIVSATTAFLTEISPNGRSFSSSTCIGGSDNNLGQSISVTPSGAVYLSGITASGAPGSGTTPFPTTSGAVQTTNAGLYDAFAIGIEGLAANGELGGPPSVHIDIPAPGAVLSGTVPMEGWAIDNTTSAAGTAISSVQVFVDGGLAGTATYGTNRSDVCAAYPGRVGCPNVGFTYLLNTAALSPGPHTITVYAVDSDVPSPDVGSASVTVTVSIGAPSGPPSVNIDLPAPNTAVSGTVSVVGWAIDNASAVGTAINPTSVQVKVDGVSVGTATYGAYRLDVCTAYPVRAGCPNVGFTYSLNTAALSHGSHTITVYAADSDVPSPERGLRQRDGHRLWWRAEWTAQRQYRHPGAKHSCLRHGIRGGLGHRQRLRHWDGHQSHQRASQSGRCVCGHGHLWRVPLGCVHGLPCASRLPQRGLHLFVRHGSVQPRSAHHYNISHRQRRSHSRHRRRQCDGHCL